VCELFRDRRRELAGVSELEGARLLGNGAGDLAHAVPDEVDGGRAGEVEVALAGGVVEPDAFAANGLRLRPAERAREGGGPGHRDRLSGGIAGRRGRLPLPDRG